MYVAHQSKLEHGIEELRAHLGPEVVRMRYSLDRDWSGDPSIYFRIVLKDEFSRGQMLSATTARIRDTVRNVLEPELEWGLNTYFNFRNETEAAKYPEAIWE